MCTDSKSMSISPSTSSHVVSDDSLGFVANIRSFVWVFGGSFDLDVVMCACRYNPILFLFLLEQFSVKFYQFLWS